MKLKLLLAGALAAVALAPAANAATVTWTTWNPSTVTTGLTGAGVSGTAGALTVTYTGELRSLQTNYPSWTPTGSYVGGIVGNAPPQSGGITQLFGGAGTGVDTITFSSAVVNPIVAIWSLGAGGTPAQFDFTATPTIVAGGPSAEYGGTGLSLSGNNVSGLEGNGVVQFQGTYTSLTFTTPQFENWYGFTVGYVSAAVPEPASWAMMLTGLGLVGGVMRSRKRAVAAA